MEAFKENWQTHFWLLLSRRAMGIERSHLFTFLLFYQLKYYLLSIFIAAFLFKLLEFQNFCELLDTQHRRLRKTKERSCKSLSF